MQKHQSSVSFAMGIVTFPTLLTQRHSVTNVILLHFITGRQVHDKLRPYGCPDCDKKFGEKSNATKHYKSVHERQKNATCEECGAVFVFRDGLSRHVRSTEFAVFSSLVCLEGR
jgi:uncharacterized C2H2 Zn-finger protein